jgi:biotin carboxylase
MRLLLISHHDSYRIAPYIKAANGMGLEVTIASEGRHSLISEVASGIHVSFSDQQQATDTILEQHGKTPFHGVLGSDDITVELAAKIAKTLGLVHNPPQAALWSSRKDLARAHLMLAGSPVPINCLVDLYSPLEKQAAGLPWPCVIKPLNLSASRGVIRADNPEEFIIACKRIEPILRVNKNEFERTHILVEEYIDGIEIAFEGYLHKGQLYRLTLFDKPDPLTGPFFEETIYVTPSRLNDSLQQSIKDVIQQACRAYGLVTGPVHAECRIDQENKVWILEIASRTIGGDCARLLDSEEFGIEELAIALAINQPVVSHPPAEARGVMMIPIRKSGLLRRIEGLLNARDVPGVDRIDIVIPEGHELVPLPEGNQYLGYIFASGDDPEMVTAALRHAHECLEIVTAPVFKPSFRADNGTR